MKKTLHVFASRVSAFFAIILIGGILNNARAQSNISTGSQITFTGASTDFTGAGYTGYTDQGTGSVTYYVGFDNTYLYIGAFRNTSMGSSDNLTVYIDTDPNATPTGGTGSTSGQSYNSVTGTLPFSANYDAHVEQSYQEMKSYVSSWSTVVTGFSVYTTGSSREIMIPLSSIGSPSALYVTCWMGYSGGTYANAPGTNVGGSNPTTVGYFGGFGLSSTGCNPTTSLNTAITASCVNAAPASGATYGYVSETSGSFTAAGNFSVANGGSINVAGGTLALGANTVTMGQSGLTTGNAATLNYSSGTLTTTGSTLNFVSNGYFTGATATSANNVTINNGTLNLTTVPTINGTLQINGGSVSAAPIYGAASTLYYNVSYGRYNEWNAVGIGTIGVTPGYPHNVTINTGTFDVYNGASGVARALSSTLTINNGAAMNFNAMNAAFTVGGGMNINTGGSLNMNTMTAVFSVAASLNINGTLTLSSSPGGDMTAGLNWTNNGTFTSNGRLVTFNGSVIQHIIGPVLTTFGYLTVNNAAGVQLQTPTAVANVLTLTNGIVTTSATNTLSVTNTAATAVTGGSTTAYISGPLNWTLPSGLSASASSYAFPVGGTTTYLPFALTTLTTGATTPVIQVQAFNFDLLFHLEIQIRYIRLN